MRRSAANAQARSRWLFGNEAARIVGDLDQKLQLLTSNHAGVEHYSPWLCAPRPHLDLKTPDLIVKNPEVLSEISKLYGGELETFDLEGTGFAIRSQISTFDLQVFERCAGAFSCKSNVIEPLFRTVVQNVVPINSVNKLRRKNGVGFSSIFARNSIFLSIPECEFFEFELVANIAHEVGHQVLTIYQSADPIIKSDPTAPVYSGIRKCLRPAILSFHASVALAFMIEAFHLVSLGRELTFREAEYINERIKELQLDLTQTLINLKKCEFTELGERLLSEMSLRVS